LDAKRSLLSRAKNSRSRLYINSANWHTNKPDYRAGNQSQSADTLHTIYMNGTRLSMKRLSDTNRFEYRELDLAEE
jgi:hypothetical protein